MNEDSVFDWYVRIATPLPVTVESTRRSCLLFRCS